MNLIKHLSAVAALAGAIAVPSLAQAEQSSVHLNVHTGPGTQYGVIDVLSPGEHVNVTRRSGSWCYLDKAGQDGWAVCHYLTADEAGPRPGPDYSGGYDHHDNGRPNVSIGFSIPGFTFHVGPGGFDYGRGRGDHGGHGGRGDNHGGQICFYQNHNFNGRSLCMKPGDSYAQLHTWNDKISSVRVSGGAQATVCEDYNYRGHCTTITSDDRNLGNGDNKISSIRVNGGPGNGHGNDHGHGDNGGRVCFYQNNNYNGRSLCMNPGDSYAQLHTWNDKISSIRVSGGAEALVCEDWNYKGRCVTIDRDVSSLGNQGNDKISSIRVH